MQHIRGIQLVKGSREELLPGFSPDFPYIAACAEMENYPEPEVPWHWHPTVELFYMESGALEYTTPGGSWVFPAGSGGLMNSNVLHTSKTLPSGEATVQLLHLFEPELLSGGRGTRMDTKYIRPLTCAGGIEMIALSPSDPAQAALLEKIRASFALSEEDWGYEFALRQQLTEIWLEFFALARPAMGELSQNRDGDAKMKAMMQYIQEHYPEPLSVEQIAKAAHVSKRVCFRLFRERIHMTPVAYLTSCRLRKACRMLAESRESITQIAYACGLGSSSYFGKTFREHFGCTPAQYRRDWQDRDINKHE